MAPILTTGAGCFLAIAGGGAYTGPGDVQAFAGWWGFRAYSAAKAGTKAIRVVAADTTQTDINSLANGSLDSATLAAFIVTHGACKVVTMYDQVGTNDMTQATGANQPAILANALGSSYGAFFNGSTQQLASISNIGAPQPFTISAVGERTSGTAFSDVFSSDVGGTIQVGFSNSANNALIFAGTVVSVPSVSDNAFHAINVAITGATTIYQIDSLTGTVSPGTTGMGGGSSFIGQSGTGSNNLIGVVLEVGYVGSAIPAGTETSLNTNQHAAYGGW